MATATTTKTTAKTTATKNTPTKAAKSATKAAKSARDQIAAEVDVESLSHRIGTRLDSIQGDLPRFPSKWMELNRAVTNRTISTNRRNLELLLDSVQTVAKSTDTGVRTVAGTIRSSLGQTVDVATTGLRQISGQTSAQVRIAVDAIDEQITDLADEAAERLDTSIAQVKTAERRDEKRHLNLRTKDELYEQAQVLDIDGRADMNKSELVNAIAKVV